MSKRHIEQGESSKSKRIRSSRCNYCFRERELVPFKPYSTKCAKDAIECIVCHRPLPVRLVEASICNACRKKQYRNCQQGLGGAASIVNITRENIDDPLTITNAKKIAKKEIRAKLSEYNGIKWYFTLIVTMFKFNREREEITISASEVKKIHFLTNVT